MYGRYQDKFMKVYAKLLRPDGKSYHLIDIPYPLLVSKEPSIRKLMNDTNSELVYLHPDFTLDTHLERNKYWWTSRLEEEPPDTNEEALSLLKKHP